MHAVMTCDGLSGSCMALWLIVCPAAVCLVPQVRDGLVPLISEMREKGSPPDDAWLKGKYDTDTQVGGALNTGFVYAAAACVFVPSAVSLAEKLHTCDTSRCLLPVCQTSS
jgi:hypothetical protein